MLFGKRVNNMPKVGIFLDSTPGAGAFQYCLAMLEAFYYLSENGYNITVAYRYKEWEKYFDNKYSFKKVFIKDKTLPVIKKLISSKTINLSIKRNFLSNFHSIPASLKAEKCHLWIFPSRNDWFSLTRVKSIQVIHDLMHRYERKFEESSANGEYERRENICWNINKFCEGVIVDSLVGKKQYIESYSIDESKVFDLPFIPPKYIFKYKSLEDNYFKARYGLPEKYIFYPARFWPHKNHINLIKAVYEAKKEIDNIFLALTGSKDTAHFLEVEKLIEKLRLKNNIKIFGYVEDKDIVQFYKHARMLVMPTYYGPTNIPPIEAISLNCPVAVSGIYGMPEQLEDASLYFNPDNVDEITEVIINLWNDDNLRQKLINNGNKIIEKYTQENFNKKVFEIVSTRLK